MDTSTTADNRRSFSLTEFFLKPVPETLLGRTFFWGVLPVALFLFTVGVSFLVDSPFSIYFPFLALFGGIATLRWRTLGLSCTYGALGLLFFSVYKEIPVADRLWQMGLLFALAVDFYIALLAVEEIEAVLSRLSELGRTKSNELVQAQLAVEQMQQQSQQMQRGLEEEIKQLKEEAEQRRIERTQDERRLSLIQSEINLLNEQKSELVEEARRAREILERQSTSDDEISRLHAQLESAEASRSVIEGRVTELSASRDELQQKVVEVSASRDELEQKVTDLDRARGELEARIVEFESAPPVEGVDSAEYRRLEGLYTQLRSQFNEKARILTQTRKELFHTQGKLEVAALEEERRAVDPDRTDAAQYEEVIDKLISEIEQLEEEIPLLEEIAGGCQK